MARTSAFTLLEILVAITIVSVLAATLAAAAGTFRQRAEQMAGLQLLARIGTAIQQSAADRNALLPGPIWPGQVAEYDPTRAGRLVRMLAPYLEIEERSQKYVVNAWLSPAYRRKMGSIAPADARVFVSNHAVETDPGASFSPWGNASLTGSDPVPLSRIPQPSKTWALCDADQWQPAVASAPWKSSTPPNPIYGSTRNQLFFDGHVEIVPVN